MSLVLVIDALDECDSQDDIKIILSLLPQARVSNAVCLRFLVTSRPELPIRLGFKQISQQEYSNIALQDIPENLVEHDILIFIHSRFRHIRKEHSLPSSWPGQTKLRALAARATPLFIFASTVCRFVADHNWNPIERLEKVLEFQTPGFLSKLDGTYLPVLNQLPIEEDGVVDHELVGEFQAIVGSIVVLADPLSIDTLARLLDIPQRRISIRLKPLHSVLDVPEHEDRPVRLLHLSFSDFLLDPRTLQKTLLAVDGRLRHRELLSHCLRVMSRKDGGLKKNICRLSDYASPKSLITTQAKETYLPPELQYACRYWIHHWEEGGFQYGNTDSVYRFLTVHALHWLEAMSILGKMSETVALADTLYLHMRVDNPNHDLVQLLYDIKRFVRTNSQMADQSPLQLYCSALAFVPQETLLNKTFQNDLHSCFARKPDVDDKWSPCIQTLEGHATHITDMVLSAHGDILASCSLDGVMMLWDIKTGGLKSSWTEDSLRVFSMDLSPDGKLLASSSFDGDVTIWDAITGTKQSILHKSEVYNLMVKFSPNGNMLATKARHPYTISIMLWCTNTWELQHTLDGTGSMSAWPNYHMVAFSPDSSLVACPIEGGTTIKIWNTATGAIQLTLEDLNSFSKGLNFSPDGKLIATIHVDKTVKLWDTNRGDLVHVLEGHANYACSTSFSPDGKLIASCPEDQLPWTDTVIRVWDTATGALQHALEGHTEYVSAVLFSPDGLLLASHSTDRTIRIWDGATGAALKVLKLTNSAVKMSFSSDSSLLASCTGGESTIRLWDMGMKDTESAQNEHTEGITTLVVSSDGNILASGSADKTVKLWDLKTGEMRLTLSGHIGDISAMSFSSKGRLLAYGSSDGEIFIWRLLANMPVGDAPYQALEHPGWVTAVVFSPNGDYLASGSSRSVWLWDTATWMPIQTISFDSYIRAICFSPNSEILACADDAVILWDTTIGEMEDTPWGRFPFGIDAMAFSPDGQWLATAWPETPEINRITLWDAMTLTRQQDIHLEFPVRWMKFTNNCQELETDRGKISLLSSNDPSVPIGSIYRPHLFIEDEWVSVNHKNLMSLPPEYRIPWGYGTYKDDSILSAVRDSFVIIGNATGQLLIMEFNV